MCRLFSALLLMAFCSLSMAQESPIMAVINTARSYVDPTMPNWGVDELWEKEDRYALVMTMKAFNKGGAGEALQLFKRRAEALKDERGYARYEILEYNEGIESGMLASKRVARGSIRMVDKVREAKAADSFWQNNDSLHH